MDKTEKKEIAKQYVKACVHYGHPPKQWNPKMAPYIVSEKQGYHIIDLVKTSKLLSIAGNILQKSLEKSEKEIEIIFFLFICDLFLKRINKFHMKKKKTDALVFCFFIGLCFLIKFIITK